MIYVIPVLIGLFYLYSLWKIHSGIKLHSAGQTGSYQIGISLIIAARNEEDKIESVLNAIQKQDYNPENLEIILVDDHSSDHTMEIAEKLKIWNLTILSLSENREQGQLSNRGKKNALNMGINNASHNIIVTTDADCTMGVNWLSELTAFFQNPEIQMVAGSVFISTWENDLIQIFQAYDQLAMNAIGIAAFAHGDPFLANGANLSFRKDAFFKVGGYEGINQIASGDDVLLLQKFKKAFPNGLKYCELLDSVVYTGPLVKWVDLWQQRLRWASKSRQIKSKLGRMIMYSGYLFNLLLPVLILLGFIQARFWILLLALWIPVLVFQLLIIGSVARKYDQPFKKAWYFPVAIVYIPYVILVGILATFIPYKWKGRKTR